MPLHIAYNRHRLHIISFDWVRRHPVNILDASMEPRNSVSQSAHIRWEDAAAEAVPPERERIEIQNYINEARRVADQRDLLAYIKYGSSKYHEKLVEVERHEQDLAEQRHSLLKDYPNRAELQKLSAVERRREIIARDSRFYGVSACIAGLLMAVAGISAFVYCRVHPDGTTGNPLLLLGLAAFGLLLSVGTSKHVGKAIGELPRFWKS